MVQSAHILALGDPKSRAEVFVLAPESQGLEKVSKMKSEQHSRDSPKWVMGE